MNLSAIILLLGLVGLSIFFLYRKLHYKKRNVLAHDEIQKIKSQLESHKAQVKQAKLSDAEANRLLIVATQTDNAIMVMDAEGNIEWINDGFTRMYEYTFEQFIRIRGSNILQTSFNPLIKERLDRCRNTLQPVTYEALNVTPSGREIWTHTSLNPIVDEEGKLIHMATIDSDISQRVNAGEQLLSQLDVLTNKINTLQTQLDQVNGRVKTMFEVVKVSNKKVLETDMIIDFIKELSEKIRIMGINASIESRVAGEAGLGFRVISQEIVKMSDDTKDSATKIYDILNSVRESTEEINSGRLEVESAFLKYKDLIKELNKEVKKVEAVAEELR